MRHNEKLKYRDKVRVSRGMGLRRISNEAQSSPVVSWTWRMREQTEITPGWNTEIQQYH